jgi:mono/diheme cytochrome c family protein
MGVAKYHRQGIWASGRWLPGLLALSFLATEAAPQTSPESGKALFGRYCTSCHGADARGHTPLAELLKTPPPDLTLIAQRKDGWFPDDVVLATIDGRFVVHGAREMPVWGTVLGSDQMALVTEYLYSLQRSEAD